MPRTALPDANQVILLYRLSDVISLPRLLDLSYLRGLVAQSIIACARGGRVAEILKRKRLFGDGSVGCRRFRMMFVWS